MPILQAEPAIFPPDLLDRASGVAHDPDRSWWVLHTKHQQEKRLAHELFSRHIPFYLPLNHQPTRYGRRIITSHLPLFPGYVFLLANSTERLQALKTARVVQTLPVPDPVGLLRDLQQIDQLLSSQMLVTLESSLVPGDNVLINSGPLVGLRGKIKRVATESRFVVEVDFIRQGASVVLDESVLLPVPDEKKPTASEMRDKRS